jgi:N-acetylglucosamine kinase-like BadF-type ATPase
MILIADSGSTKTSWSLIHKDLPPWFCSTGGINPFHLNRQAIVDLLKKELNLPQTAISSVYFYGSGCTPEKALVVAEALAMYFQTKQIEVYSDLLAAARSLSPDEEGIVCILGTGSNSCYYDGERIVRNVSPLGYILGDEGSGAVLGKKLVADILKQQVSQAVIRDFYATYDFSPAEILDRVYRQPFPNRFLAQLVPFIARHIDELQVLVETGFDEFITRNVLQYEKAFELPIHFTGSIAFHFQPYLQNSLTKHHLRLGRVTQEPLPSLIEYYKNRIFK